MYLLGGGECVFALMENGSVALGDITRASSLGLGGLERAQVHQVLIHPLIKTLVDCSNK